MEARLFGLTMKDLHFLPADTTGMKKAGPSTQEAIEKPPMTEKEEVRKSSSGSSVDKENPHTWSDRGEKVTVSNPTVGDNGTPATKVQYNMDDKATPGSCWMTTDMNDSATAFTVSPENWIPIPKVRERAKRTN
ncbi:hypothetical protein QYM36_013805 [Artemia franciscana]|uniref:Uncharacterized protein n=1 Tax=Artemia franciscana TaxID=6661 RepID=A0AA88KWS4_ARTSF|nr:hypothetical protein QYM36_013805 [Artemia franciscana]